MSRFHGPQGKGALKRYREGKRAEAEQRQEAHRIWWKHYCKDAGIQEVYPFDPIKWTMQDMVDSWTAMGATVTVIQDAIYVEVAP